MKKIFSLTIGLIILLGYYNVVSAKTYYYKGPNGSCYSRSSSGKITNVARFYCNKNKVDYPLNGVYKSKALNK